MKYKYRTALYCALVICVLTGCQLARENDGGMMYEDRLTGVFITAEHLDLFNFEGYLNDNLNHISGGEIVVNGDADKYQGRIYASLTTKTLTNEETGETAETEEYVFEDVEGISFFSAVISEADGEAYITSISDEAISDGHMGIAYKDGGKSTTLEGTIYVTPTGQNRAFYLNPVYQTADGQVYLTAGTGLSAPMDAEGAQMSQSMDSTTTVTTNGEAETDSLSVTVSISVLSAPKRIALLQMDIDNKLLSQSEYDPGEMPDIFIPEAETAYLIVETQKQGSTGEHLPSREIYGKGDDRMEYFIVREDGICVKRGMQIDWPE